MHLTLVWFTKIHPLWRQSTIDKPAQSDSESLCTFSANFCGMKATRATDLEIVWNCRFIDVLEFVGARLEFGWHTGEDVWAGSGGSNGDGLGGDGSAGLCRGGGERYKDGNNHNTGQDRPSTDPHPDAWGDRSGVTR